MLEAISRRSNFLSNKPHFFRIIHPTLLKDGKPEIPKRFLREYGKHLPSIIFLEVPTGTQWRVELMKGHGGAWLQGGWQEFCDFYSIGYGHFLLFRYDGGSHFHVLVFDRTASEIEYPSHNPSPIPEKEANNNHGLCLPSSILEENHESDVSVEILGDFSPNQTNKEGELNAYQREVSVESYLGCPPSHNTKSGCLQPEQRERKRPSPKLFNTGMKFQKLETQENGREVNFDAKESGGGKATATQGAVPAVTASEKRGALLRALSFKPQNPFFIITMQPCYVSTAKVLNIPQRFVRRYFTTDNDKATLCISNGRSWSVKYYLRRFEAKFSTDWGKFAGDNCLQVGDVCVFELIKPSVNLLNVVIFRK